jgi:LmbE family N-acetylglucosaminyl deacetylase
MVSIKINKRSGIKILCLGAHCDDIEIGCGGTLMSLMKKYKGTEIHWVVFSSDSERGKEARMCANKFLKNAGRKNIEIKNFQNSYFPYIGREIKNCFEELKRNYSPDIIFTHYRKDLHQDHRTISELTWNTYRDHLVLEYEIPKFDGDFGAPNFYVPLETSTCQRKINRILTSFKTQTDKHWMDEELLRSVLRIRGMECVSPTKYAEAFYCRKALLVLSENIF